LKEVVVPAIGEKDFHRRFLEPLRSRKSREPRAKDKDARLATGSGTHANLAGGTSD
jgi:hypothetical protein